MKELVLLCMTAFAILLLAIAGIMDGRHISRLEQRIKTLEANVQANSEMSLALVNDVRANRVRLININSTLDGIIDCQDKQGKLVSQLVERIVVP